jgi:glycosyltransferase involved in cell wall biosynthesis
MRVLQVHKDFEPLGGGGGTARHIHGLARALSGLGCEVRVVAPAPERVETPYVSVASKAAGLGAHIAWADVVHVHGARSTYAAIGALLSAFKGKPFFYTPHAYYAGRTSRAVAVKQVWDRTAEHFMVTRGAGTVLLTEVWRDWYRSRGIPTARTVIIPNCVLLEDLPTARAASDAHLAGSPAILSVGRLDPVKRLHDVVAALAEPALAEGHLHIVGKGEQRAELEALAARLGVGDRVTFHGFVDDAGVTGMIGGADVFVLASEQEGLPTVLLEMLISRLPVVCSRIPGNFAIMDVAGLTSTHAVGDVPELARQLAAAPASRVGDATVAALERAFTWERRAADILSLYTAAAPGLRAAA